MAKYATERIWRDPDGNYIAEEDVKDGKNGGLGTVLAFAVGDAIEGEDEDAVPSKFTSSKEPKNEPANSMATAAPAAVKPVESGKNKAPKLSKEA